jgi:hypothetical protein
MKLQQYVKETLAPFGLLPTLPAMESERRGVAIFAKACFGHLTSPEIVPEIFRHYSQSDYKHGISNYQS